MEAKPPTEIDLGELLLESAKNAQYIDLRLQLQIANYAQYLMTPIRYVGADIKPEDMKQ